MSFKSRFRTIQCYDCGARVEHLQLHRNSCAKSRKSKTALNRTRATTQKTRKSSHAGTIDVFLLLDTSGSMAPLIQRAFEASKRVVASAQENDRVGVYTFDSQVFCRMSLRPIGQVIRQQEIEQIEARVLTQGGTAIYDAIVKAVSDIRDPSRRSIVIAVTDGEDNMSRSTLEQALACTDNPNICVHIIQVGGNHNTAYRQLVRETGSYAIVESTTIVTTMVQTFTTIARL
jgi:uncharacterized protein with von Willebrand factor type A (vWA) domain